jgi:hypothetical protein
MLPGDEPEMHHETYQSKQYRSLREPGNDCAPITVQLIRPEILGIRAAPIPTSDAPGSALDSFNNTLAMCTWFAAGAGPRKSGAKVLRRHLGSRLPTQLGPGLRLHRTAFEWSINAP